MSVDIINVLSKYYDDIGWSIVGSLPTTEVEYDERFTSEGSKPTWSDLQTKLVEMQKEYDTTEYQRNRKLEYGTWEEQLDMMHHGTWKAHVQTIRDKYPK